MRGSSVVLIVLLIFSLISPSQHFAQAASTGGSAGGGSRGGGGGSGSRSGSGSAARGSAGAFRSGASANIKFGASGFRPLSVRALSQTSGARANVSNQEYLAATSILNPLNPMNPLSPLNPINQMSLRDEEGDTIFKKVLRIDHEGGAFRTYQCLLHVDELSKPEPMEQNCVLLSSIGETQVAALINKSKSCSELDAEDWVVLSLLGVVVAMTSTTFSIIAVDLIYSLEGVMGRTVLIGTVIPTVLAVAGASYLNRVSCEDGVSMLAKRFFDEINNRVPADQTRLIPVSDKIWLMLDTVLKKGS